MSNTSHIKQLIDSMEIATSKLMTALDSKDYSQANNLRILIFDFHNQLKNELNK